MKRTVIKSTTAKYLLYILFGVVCLTACTKMLDVPVPDNKTIGKQVFGNKDSAVAAVSGVYSGLSLSTNLISGATSVYTGVYCDELAYTAAQPSIVEFYNSTLTSDNTTVREFFWNAAYRYIYSVNACIEGLEDSKELPAALKNQLLGECHFLRALIYFHLTNCFGAVPLVKVTSYLENEKMPRTPVTTVETFIESELITAKTLLSIGYPSTDRARANKWSACALLATYYLHRKQWAAAEREATDVINAGYYRLEALNDVFLAVSNEAIFQLQPVLTGYNTMEGNWLIPAGSGRPSFALTDSLLAAFEPGDKRLTEWVRNKVVAGKTYYYPFKYKKRSDFSPGFVPTEYTTVLRLAEMYLIRAECRLAAGQLPGAIEDIDMVRRRAELPLIAETQPLITVEELSAKIMHERRIELFAEWGHRWYDLKRSGKVSEVMKTIKPRWRDTDSLWPIPASQILLNPALEQNPGYN